MGKYKFRIKGKFGFTKESLWIIQYSGMNILGEKGPSVELIVDGMTHNHVLIKGNHYFVADKRATSNQIFYFIYYAQKEKQT
jgi:hypothetical protein